MAIRQTIQIGHSRLKAKNKEITDFKSAELKQLIEDLRDTMYEKGLIGIAAPQIGENYKVFITEPRETEARPADQADILRVYINPHIIEKSSEKIIIWEGCGSVSNAQLFAPVSRAKIITVEAYDENGKKFRFKIDGILGRVIQHECDHLNGIEFLERVTSNKEFLAQEFYIERVKNLPEQKAAQKITIKEFSKQ